MKDEDQTLTRALLALISNPGTGDDRDPAAMGRNVRLQAGLAAYERARGDGLCHEGAWECALEAMRAFDVAT